MTGKHQGINLVFTICGAAVVQPVKKLLLLVNDKKLVTKHKAPAERTEGREGRNDGSKIMFS